MANNLGSLVVSLGLDAAEFTRGMSKGEYEAKRSTERIKGQFDGLMKYVAGLGLGAVLVGAVKSTANYADELGKAARRAGETAEEFSRLAYAARQSDVDNGQLAKGLRELGADAAEGGKKLEALGIAVTGNDGRLKTNAQLFRELADVIASTEDPQRRATLAAAALGDKLGPELIPLLAAGSSGLQDLSDEAERLGRVLNDDAVKAAEAFNDNLSKLDEASAGLAANLGNVLIPQVNRLVNEFLTGQRYANGFFDAIFTFGTAGVFDSPAAGAKHYREELEALRKIQADMRDKPWSFDVGSGVRVNAVGLDRDIEVATKRLAYFNDLNRQGITYDAGDQTSAEARRLGLVRPTRVPTPKAGPSKKPGTGLTDAQKAEQQYQADLLKYAQDEDDYRQRLFAKRLQEQDDLEKQYQDDLLQYERDLDDYRQRMFARRIEEEEKAQLDAAERVRKAAEEAIAAQQRQVQRLGDAFASTFDRAFRDGMKFGDLLKKLAFDAINIQFLTPATQAAGSALGKAASAIFASFEGGGYTGSGSRSGGIDGKGGFMAVLHPNETVVDHTRGQGAGGSGGGVTIVQSFSIDARGADAGVDQRIRAAMEQSKRETLAAVRANVNRGGSWASTMGRA